MGFEPIAFTEFRHPGASPTGPAAPYHRARASGSGPRATGEGEGFEKGTDVARLLRVELHHAQLRFRAPVVTAAGVHAARPVAFLRIETDEGEGFGECAALNASSAVDPAYAQVARALAEAGVERLLDAARARGGQVPAASQVAALFGSGPCARVVGAAVEMAVLDAELRASGQPLWSRLGVDEAVAEAGVPVGHLVGIPPDRRIDALVAEVAPLVDGAATARVRVKIEPGWDAGPLRALRAAFPDLVLQADANGSYRMGSGGPDDAGRLVQLDPLGLACIEQPLPPADLVALGALAARLETPVALDESLTSLRRLRDALRYGACEVACIKPARLGGLLAARAAAATCAEAGAGAFVGGFFETGFARSASAALAGLRAFTLVGDLSDPGTYLEGPVGARSGAYPGLRRASVQPFGGPGIAPAPQVLQRRPARTWRV